MISANLSALFYLLSGILFILALRGLSSPDTSRQGNYFGIAGMVIAIVVTFLSVENASSSLIYVILFLVIGGAIGAIIAFKIPMTAMPELVAGFHSLVGLAAVFVAIAAFLNPQAFGLGSTGNIKLASLIEMSLGAAVGAIVGGALANENQKTKTTTGIVGYEDRQKCETKFKNSPKEEVVYSYSTITFTLDGQEQTIEFQKMQ